MADSKVDLFTTAMRTEFITAFMATAEPAEYEQYTAVIPSTARIENYAWMSPVPAVKQFQGHRQYGKISEIKYTVENLEYDSAFEVLLRDIQDDQVGGYKLKPEELAEKAKKFPGRLVLSNVAKGKSTTCFDGSNFFASSHTVGTAGTNGNALTFTGSGDSSGDKYNFIVLVQNGPLKPLVYQDRKSPAFETDAGSPESKRRKVVTYWIDMEGAAAFGHWWDACLMECTNKPTIGELQTMLGNIENQFRTFALPSGMTGDLNEYVHEQLKFTERNVTLLHSSNAANLVRTVLQSATIVNGSGPVTNIYQGWATPVTSGLLNTIS